MFLSISQAKVGKHKSPAPEMRQYVAENDFVVLSIVSESRWYLEESIRGVD